MWLLCTVELPKTNFGRGAGAANMSKRESPHVWQIARLEFAFFDARFDRWTLYQKFNGSHAPEFSTSEAVHRSHIQQLLNSAENCLKAALKRVASESDTITWGTVGGNPDFYFCPCVLARHRSRTVPAVEDEWRKILEYYQEVLHGSGLSKTQHEPLIRLLRASTGSQEAVIGACPIAKAGKSLPSGTICPQHNSQSKTCTQSLSFDGGLQLVSILPIQRQWDLFGYWSTRHPDCGFWSARLRFPKNTKNDSRSKSVLGYEVRVQLSEGSKGSIRRETNEQDFFDGLSFTLGEKETSAYLAYAAFIDELQPRLAPKTDGTTPTEYIVAYPIVVHGRTHLLQIRLVTVGTPDVSILHQYWRDHVHPKLADQNFSDWFSRMLEHVAVESFQFHVSQALLQLERIPVFSRKYLASIFCANVNHLLPAEEAFIRESGELWGYREEEFGRKWRQWRRGSEPYPFQRDVTLADYGIEIKLNRHNSLFKTTAGQKYAEFLLQQQWHWFERYAIETASSRAGTSIKLGSNGSPRFDLAGTALFAVGREMDRQDREKNNATMSRSDLAIRLHGTLAQFNYIGSGRKLDLTFLFQETLPAVAPWKGKEERWSLADMFGLPPSLKETEEVPVEALDTAEKALKANWRELMAFKPKGTGLLNHFGDWLDKCQKSPQLLQEVQQVVDLVEQLDWNTKPESSIQTVKGSNWFQELRSQLSGSQDFSKFDPMQRQWDEDLSKPILAIGTQNSTWAQAPTLVDEVRHHRGTTQLPPLREAVCQRAGIPMSDILLIHNVAVSNSGYAGPIKWVGWRTDNHSSEYLGKVELAWRVSNCVEKDPEALSLLRTNIMAKVEGINEMTLGSNGELIEDIVRVVCYRYNGIFYFSTGPHYLKITCQNGSAKVDDFVKLNQPEEAAYYCIFV